MGIFTQVAGQEKAMDNKADVAMQVVQEPQSQSVKAEPTYTSTGVQHCSYLVTSSVVPITSQGQG